MNYKVTISTDQEVEKLYKCLLSEKIETKRANIDIQKNNQTLIIEVTAEDSTALRAMLNGVTKLLQIYEKVN